MQKIAEFTPRHIAKISWSSELRLFFKFERIVMAMLDTNWFCNFVQFSGQRFCLARVNFGP